MPAPYSEGVFGVKPDKVNPREVFYQPSRMVVPLFQRPYVWSKERQWQPLWEDIVRLTDVLATKNPLATHFLGAFVVQQLPSTLGTMPEWSVIDGQQRLTTLQILLDALHSQLEAHGLAVLAAQVDPLISNPVAFHKKPEDRFKVWPTNHDRSGFESVMGAPTPVDYAKVVPSRLADAHEFFSAAIQDWLELEGNLDIRAKLLVDAVSGQLEIVSIRLDASEDAQAIFETLNARGEPLSAADLIKNFVFQNHPGTDEQVEAAYLTNWAELETPWWVTPTTAGRITHPRASWFLWHWLRARLLEDFPIRELFTQFKAYVADSGIELAALLPEVKVAADRYRFVIEGSQAVNGPLTRAQWFSYRVGTLDSEVVRPLLIWLDEQDQSDVSDDDKTRILKSLESWFVRRAIVKAPSQGANRFIVDLMLHLSKKPHNRLAQEVETYFASNNTPVGYWPDDAEVTHALWTAPAYNKYLRARLRMILEALEDYRRGYPDWKAFGMGPIARNVGTIEHLLPRMWRANWPLTLSGEQNLVKEATRDRALHELGNLTLVTQKLNSKVSHGSWAMKVAHFQQFNDVLLTNDVVQSNPGSWDEELVAARTAALTAAILQVWPAPPGHVGLGASSIEVPATTGEVDLAVLVSEGLVQPGAIITARPTVLAGATAAVGLDGRIFIGEEGFDTPSAAGVAVNVAGLYKGGINGWRFWKVQESGKSLWEIRNEYRASLGDQSDGDESDEDSRVSERIEAELVAAEDFRDGAED
jgi:type II secretory pathway pseudopilin PulG